MNNNFEEIMLCSMDKIVSDYSNKGFGKGKEILLISIVNKILNNIGFMLNTKERTHLNNFITVLGNSSNNLCIYDSKIDFIYQSDDCMNPTYESNSNTHNRKPNVSDVTIIL